MNQNPPPHGDQGFTPPPHGGQGFAPPPRRGQGFTASPSQIMTSDPQHYASNVLVIQEPANRYPHFYNRFCMGLGITQIVIGVLAIVCNLVIYLYPYQTSLSDASHGTWGGIFFAITGLLGTAAGYIKSKCLIVAYMVMSIIAICLPAPNMLSTSISDLVFLNTDIQAPYFFYNRVGSAMECFILMLSLIELVIGFISALVCGHAIRCCQSPGGCCIAGRCCKCDDITTSNPQQYGGTTSNPQQYGRTDISEQEPLIEPEYIVQPSAVTTYPSPSLHLQQQQAMAQSPHDLQPQGVNQQPPVYEKHAPGMDQQPVNQEYRTS